MLELILASSPKKKLPSVSELLSFDVFSLCSSKIKFDVHPHCKISSSTKKLLQRCQNTIETRIHRQQNEVTFVTLFLSRIVYYQRQTTSIVSNKQKILSFYIGNY